MRKHIVLLLLLCLNIAARGQTIGSLDDIDLSGLPKATQAKALRYWFDDDGGNIQTVSQLSGSQSLDVSQLIEGMHTLHYQVIDTEGSVSCISSCVFLKVNSQSGSQQAKSLSYWFDDDAAGMKTIASGGVQILDVSSLLEGLHTIHYQVKGMDGQSYYIASRIFMKMGINVGTETLMAKKLMYWFDDEAIIKDIDVTGGVQLLDASGLIEGLHTLHYQVLCNNGQITPAKSSIFLRLNVDSETTVAKSMRYWFDDEQTVTDVSITEGIQMLDASKLIEGLHTVHYQIKDNKGTLGAPVSSVFLKMDYDNAAVTAKSIRYWFDDDASTLKVIDVANGTQTLDVSGLPTGMHTLNYQLIDNNGKVGVPVTGLFMKSFDKVLADGKNRIVKYQYWLNKNSRAMLTVELTNATNPYQLISLLPVQKEPIHSDYFQFEVTDGVPTVYAKNVFHIRFYDATNYFSDKDHTFVDYSVKQEVTDITLLESGVRATTAKPAENVIKWYCLQAEPGDSLQFKLDRAATIQLFSPSGEELYSVSGAESVKWGGLHVYETGTFYLALHDVTAKQGTTISIDYNHIDKYAVLRQDVNVVGNGGCSTITFEGNGFKNLYAVDFYTEQGDSIHHVDIGHESDATTSVTFDFSGAIIGMYNAKFYFADEDRVFNNMITIENAKDIELETTVTYPSTFLRGTSVTYTVNITNKGNMTAYNVPIYVYVSSKEATDITGLSLRGLDLLPLYDFMNTDYWTDEERLEMKAYSDEIGEEHYFYKIKLYDEEQNDSVVVRKAFLFASINPSDTKQFTLTLHSQQTVNAYFTIPTEWNSLTDNEMSEAKLSQRKQIKEKYCCYHDGFECALNSFAYSTSWVAVGALAAGQAEVTAGAELVGCTSSGISMLSNIGATFACDRDKKLWGEKLRFGKLLSWAGTFGGCLTGALRASKEVKTAISFGINQVQMPFNLADCAQSGKKPGCPPNPPKGGTSEMRNSCEPNDMFGYTAESGSKAIKDGKTDLWYTIQFENDTVFATAPAHDIYLTDTLDVNLFDLSTYRPTKIKIGDKSMELTGERNFISTMDMRPEIYAIAQIEGTIDDKTGIVRWHISSLDPMTMEPIQDAMTGVLPVNYDGSGLGEASYNISLKPNLPHGTVIPNRSGNIFDNNETVLTPTWTNIIDRIAPESHVTDVKLLTDTTATVSIDASDELSGPWRYDVYVQYGEDAPWWKMAENVPVDTTATVKIYPGINHGFYVVMTDSAGNVERKEAKREFTLNRSTTIHGDVNGDNIVNGTDIQFVINIIVFGRYEEKADINKDGVVNGTDIQEVINIIVNGQ